MLFTSSSLHTCNPKSQIPRILKHACYSTSLHLQPGLVGRSVQSFLAPPFICLYIFAVLLQVSVPIHLFVEVYLNTCAFQSYSLYVFLMEVPCFRGSVSDVSCRKSSCFQNKLVSHTFSYQFNKLVQRVILVCCYQFTTQLDKFSSESCHCNKLLTLY